MRSINRSPSRLARRLSLLLFLAVVAAVTLMPIYLMGVTGLKSAKDVALSTMWSLPRQLNGGGFGEAWQRLSANMLNTLMMVIPATVLSSLLGAVNGFIFSKFRFRGAAVLYLLVLFGIFMPYQSVLIPLIRTLQAVHLYGKIAGLVVAHTIYGIPITTLIFCNYYAAVPTEVVEAAKIDGCGFYGIFLRVMLPLAIPGFLVVGIFQFTNIWNDFLFGITIVPSPIRQPIMVALNNLSGSFSVDWNVVMAGAILAALPTMIVYICLGRYFIQGLLSGSVKG